MHKIRASLDKIRSRIEKDLCLSLIQSMEARVKTSGGHTKYSNNCKKSGRLIEDAETMVLNTISVFSVLKTAKALEKWLEILTQLKIYISYM